jgi:SNF2 family DNA or RNA helicase
LSHSSSSHLISFTVNRFLPACDVFVFSGSEESRNLCFEKDLKHGQFDVVVTSYEVAVFNSRLLNFDWDAIILDEGSEKYRFFFFFLSRVCA